MQLFEGQSIVKKLVTYAMNDWKQSHCTLPLSFFTPSPFYFSIALLLQFSTSKLFESSAALRFYSLIWGDSKKVVPLKWRKNAMKKEDDQVES